MRGEAGGFWMVLYLTEGARRDEEGPVTARLRREFAVDVDETFGRMRLLHCRP